MLDIIYMLYIKCRFSLHRKTWKNNRELLLTLYFVHDSQSKVCYKICLRFVARHVYRHFSGWSALGCEKPTTGNMTLHSWMSIKKDHIEKPWASASMRHIYFPCHVYICRYNVFCNQVSPCKYDIMFSVFVCLILYHASLKMYCYRDHQLEK